VHRQFGAVIAPNETKTPVFVELFDGAGKNYDLQLLEILIPFPAFSRGDKPLQLIEQQ